MPYDLGHAAPADRLTAQGLRDPEQVPTGHFGIGADVRAPEDPHAVPEPAEAPTAVGFIAGPTALTDRLHAAGPTVIGSTIGPCRGTVHEGHDSEGGQAARRESTPGCSAAPTPSTASWTSP